MSEETVIKDDEGIDLGANLDELESAYEAAVKVDTVEDETEEPAEEAGGEPDDEPDEAAAGADDEPDDTDEVDDDTELETKTDEERDQDVSHAEKSWMGRKIKGAVEDATKVIRDENAELKDTVNQLIGELRAMKPDEPDTEAGSDDDILTRGDLKKMFAAMQEQTAAERERTVAEAKQFEDGYLKRVADLEDTMEPDQFKEIEKRLTGQGSKFNIIRHNDPAQDFEHNLSDAMLDYVKTTTKTKKPKLKGESAKGKGVGGDSVVDKKGTKGKADITDPAALEFLASLKERDVDTVALMESASTRVMSPGMEKE